MTKFDTIGRTLAAALCTVVFSTVMVAGAAGPGQAGGPAGIVRAVA